VAVDGAAPGVRLPAFHRFEAPATWRAIDFISDLHLSPALPRTVQAWQQHLLHTPADAVFMLGDVFEVWVGDDARHQAFEQRCVQVMAEASCHRCLGFMAGNRDFLLGSAMLQACGLLGLPDPTRLSAFGHQVLLTHGDALCLDDTAYQRFRAEVRQPAWQASFLAKPLAERQAIAAEIRRASRARQGFDSREDVDLDAASSVHWLHTTGSTTLLHGHTHRPAQHELGPGLSRWVLSDWDLDHAPTPRADVLRLDQDGLHRVAPATAPAAD
jgi:UDP-2,3-diacylglucosamine hydrolase